MGGSYLFGAMQKIPFPTREKRKNGKKRSPRFSRSSLNLRISHKLALHTRCPTTLSNPLLSFTPLHSPLNVDTVASSIVDHLQLTSQHKSHLLSRTLSLSKPYFPDCLSVIQIHFLSSVFKNKKNNSNSCNNSLGLIFKRKRFLKTI